MSYQFNFPPTLHILYFPSAYIIFPCFYFMYFFFLIFCCTTLIVESKGIVSNKYWQLQTNNFENTCVKLFSSLHTKMTALLPFIKTEGQKKKPRKHMIRTKTAQGIYFKRDTEKLLVKKLKLTLVDEVREQCKTNDLVYHICLEVIFV